MKENINNAVEWLKRVHTPEYNVRGCITGSHWLGYFPDQDIDLFVYDNASMRNVLYAMYYNPMFQILDETEKWKFQKYINSKYDKTQKILTIKFTYNTILPVNIILKTNATSMYGVLSSFDIDIICKGYDLETGKYLDLRGASVNKKVGSWNEYNTGYYSPELWEAKTLLRQLDRAVKYYERGYNTDHLVIKYLEMIDDIQKHQNIFKSSKFESQLKMIKGNIKIVKKLLETWLETHKISEEEINLLREKTREV